MKKLFAKAVAVALSLTLLTGCGAKDNSNDSASSDSKVIKVGASPSPHAEILKKAAEILKDIPDLDVFVAGVGTGGTVSGVGKKLKEMKKDITIIAVEPANSPVISGGAPGAHKIQGIGAGFIPEIYDKNVVDKVIQITDDEAYEGAREVASKEGVLIGISAGAALKAALKTAKEIGKGKKVLAIAPDGGEKYISMGLYD